MMPLKFLPVLMARIDGVKTNKIKTLCMKILKIYHMY